MSDLIGIRSEEEKQQFVDFHYLRGSGDEAMMPVAGDGTWAWDRDTENKGRGDAGSIKRRRESIEHSGVIDNRGGPFGFEKRGQAFGGDRFDCAHQATLMEGAKQLWEMCPDHPSLARILKFGIKHCKISFVVK